MPLEPPVIIAVYRQKQQVSKYFLPRQGHETKEHGCSTLPSTSNAFDENIAAIPQPSWTCSTKQSGGGELGG
jgi:hypothetical protein